MGNLCSSSADRQSDYNRNDRAFQRPQLLAVPEHRHAPQGATPNSGTTTSGTTGNTNNAVDGHSTAATNFGVINQHVQQQAAQAQQSVADEAAAQAQAAQALAAANAADDQPPPPEAPFSWTRGKLIGAGAFGKVYVALNNKNGEIIAVKQVGLTREEALKGRVVEHSRALVAEVSVLRQLRHENIVQYLGTEHTDECLNIFLEYVPGGSIASLIEKFGPLQETVVRIYTRQILRGLEYLHQKKIMHRDIKGANILVEKACVKLADFGASRTIEDLATMGSGAKSIRGTPYWMAPEVIKQTGHGRPADIWSLGCVVIEMSTGKPPWSNYGQVAAMFHIASSRDPPPLPPNLSAEAKDFLLLCFNRAPLDRPNATRLLKHPFVASLPPSALAVMNQDAPPQPAAPALAAAAASRAPVQAGTGWTPPAGVLPPSAAAAVPPPPPPPPVVAPLPSRQFLALRHSFSPPSPIKEEGGSSTRSSPRSAQATSPPPAVASHPARSKLGMDTTVALKAAAAPAPQQQQLRGQVAGAPSGGALGGAAAATANALPRQLPASAAPSRPTAAAPSSTAARGDAALSAGGGGNGGGSALVSARSDASSLLSARSGGAEALPQPAPPARPAAVPALNLSHLHNYVPPAAPPPRPASPPPAMRVSMMTLDYNPMAEPTWADQLPHGFFNRPLAAIRASGEEGDDDVAVSDRDSPRQGGRAAAGGSPRSICSSPAVVRGGGYESVMSPASAAMAASLARYGGFAAEAPDVVSEPDQPLPAPGGASVHGSREDVGKQWRSRDGAAGAPTAAAATAATSPAAAGGTSPGVLDSVRASKHERWRDELLSELQHKRQQQKAARGGGGTGAPAGGGASYSGRVSAMR